MWLIPTRNRPKMLAELIASMRAVDDVPECAVMHDGCAVYDIDWPKHWHLHGSTDHLEMSGAINALFHHHPNKSFYGMIDDHNRPLVKGWSKALERAAGSWGLASADTGDNRINARSGRKRLNCFAMGGELAGALGWVWPDFVVHMYGDDVLEDLGYELGILKHVPEAKFDNLLVRNGRLPRDGNHERMWKGFQYVQHDAVAYAQWRRSKFVPTVLRLRSLMADREAA